MAEKMPNKLWTRARNSDFVISFKNTPFRDAQNGVYFVS
jgi:hypothetical protein